MSETLVNLECADCGGNIPLEYELDPHGTIIVSCEACEETNYFSMEDMHSAFMMENECNCDVCVQNAQSEILSDLRREL